MLANHPALVMAQQSNPALSADPYLGLSVLASDFVADRVQTDLQARSIFCHDVLHREIDEAYIQELATALLPKEALQLTTYTPMAAQYELISGNLTLPGEEAVMQGLRRLRQAVMLRIIGRMACGIASCSVTLKETSTLADWCICFAVRLAEHRLAARHGLPVNDKGEVMQMLVIAVGKLGGKELNLSSDVDLIFVQPDRGETKAPHQLDCTQPTSTIQPIDAERFFTRVGRMLIALLDKVTSDGFVFRTDMRIRPYGDSGALVSRLAELESYYYEQARPWERFALCRARVLCGDPLCISELEKMIEGFVYRRHVDFEVIHQLRQLSSNINLMAQHQRAEDNIKIGCGGIREIEFHAQALQLVYGGVEPRLRECNTVDVLEQAALVNLMDASQSKLLSTHYLWLRDLENRLQALADEQTQRLPTNSEQLARIAAGLSCANTEELLAQLSQVRSEVHQAYSELLRRGQQDNEGPQTRVAAKWHQITIELLAGNTQPLMDLLAPTGQMAATQQPDYVQLQTRIAEFFTRVQTLDEQVHNNLRNTLPLLLQSSMATPDSARALGLVFELLATIVRRSTYLSLLRENPETISRLTHAMTISGWCARQVIERPMLLSCFLESTAVWQKPDRTRILQKLQLQLFSLPENDLEQEMDALRHFAHASRMQGALAQLSASLSLMQVSDYLSFTAEACIESACRMAWKQLATRHGAPGEDDLSGFVVIALGKLGGLELSYSSDLDLSFVFSQPADPEGTGFTNGAKPISVMQFYQRLAQRVIHLLTAPTAAGSAYSIDTRLRPNGEGGLLACSLAAWEDYYRNSAWTWELQTLTRARPICGSPRAIAACEDTRRSLLTRSRKESELKQQVLGMRERIAKTHGNKGLKHMRGGLVDMEFIVQYLALHHAPKHPEIVRFTDNVRIIQALAHHSLLANATATELKRTYLEVRNLHHANYLDIHQHSIDLPDLCCVTTLWKNIFSDAVQLSISPS